VLLEVIVETVEDAREAEQGGAGRLELVRDLARGGLTPAARLVEDVVKAVRIPVRVMLRDSEPFELHDRAEPRRLHAAARQAHKCGAAGVVLGFLQDGAPCIAAVGEVLEGLGGPATFHRAFDAAADPIAAAAAIAAEPRIDRILTSGGEGDWLTRFAGLRRVRDIAPPHLTILPGGGLDPEALRALAAGGFPEAHIGRAARVPSETDGRVRASRVAELVAIAAGRAST
jgi:copper homeostasis protein